MNNFVKSGIITLASTLFFACGASTPEPIGVEFAEYDGAYVLTTSDRFLPIVESDSATTRILYSKNGRVSTSQALNATDRRYTLSNVTEASLEPDDFKGVFVKGDYKFQYFSLHPLEERVLKKGGNELFFEKHGAVDYDVPFHLPGKQIELLKRSADEENGYYFEVKSPLKPGKYVGWISKHFWVFEIQGDVEDEPIKEKL